MSKKYLSLLIAIAMLLASVIARAAAPAGYWWDGNYQYRQQISIPAGANALITAYSIGVTVNHAALVGAGRSLASGNDVRVVYWNGTTWIELDRIAEDNAWNTSTTKVWFRTQAPINATITDDNYYLYYGFNGSSTPSSTTPLQNWVNVFSFYDDFSSAALDTTTRWTNSGATQAGGVLTVGNGAQIRSQSTFGTDTIWETRAQLSSASAPSGTAFYYWAANSSANNNFTSPYLRFFSSTIANHSAQDILASTTTFAPTSPTALQVYSFTREGSTVARFLVNGTQVATFTHVASNTALRILLANATQAGQTQQYTWARVRTYRNPEPAVSLAAQTTFTPVALASYSFEETSWNGTAGEVKDSSGNNLNGKGASSTVNGPTTANTSPAKSGTFGTCRYAALDGTNDYIRVANTAALNTTIAFGFAAWVRHRTNTYKNWEAILTKGDSAYRIHLNGACNITGTLGTNTTNGITEGLNAGCTTADLNSNQVPAANIWYHVGATFRNGEMRIYINGALINSAAFSPPTIATNTEDLAIGENLGNLGRQWTGDIDEVTLWSQPVGQATIQSHMAATHACTALHFAVSHDGYGINCAPEKITVNLLDAINNSASGYSQTITLNTGANSGTWSLVSGFGTLSASVNGVATYTWTGTETSVIFGLSFQGAGPITITAIGPGVTTGASAPLPFSPSGFTVTSSPLVVGAPPTPISIPAFVSPQTAGTNFPMNITAFGTTPTDNQCGVITAYTGAKNLKFWADNVNPNSGTRVVTINGSNISTANVLTAETAATPLAVTFTNGIASVTANYKDAGQINIGVKDAPSLDPNLPGGIRGSTGNIVVKPSTFVLSNIVRTSDGVANPGASNDSGAKFIAAGVPFTATVNAKESGGLDTPNFGKESPAESVVLTPTLVLPAGGQNPSIAGTTLAFNNGSATGTDFSWPEVGIITLTPHIKDGDYLGAGDVTGTTTGNVGRFIPYNFGVTQNAPTIAPTCAAGSFLYLGQPLTYSVAPVLSVTARAFGGATTQNYKGTFVKLTNTSSTGRSYVTSVGTLDQSGLPANDPTVLPLTNGLATLTFNTNSGLVYAHSTPTAPFTPTLTLRLNVLDTDGVAYSNSITTPSTNPFVVNAPSIAIPQQRYGRVAFRNSVGSELLNLPLPMHSEYFLSDTAGFVQNNDDTCTTGVTNALTLNLAGGSSCLLNSSSCPGPAGQQFQMPPAAGDFVAILRAPGVGYTGTVTVTASVPTWLQFDWDANASGLENPQGVATFGVFPGRSRRIFQAEK